jgi:hypothetical protein
VTCMRCAEVVSPGGLHVGLTTTDRYVRHGSHLWNPPVIALGPLTLFPRLCSCGSSPAKCSERLAYNNEAGEVGDQLDRWLSHQKQRAAVPAASATNRLSSAA